VIASPEPFALRVIVAVEFVRTVTRSRWRSRSSSTSQRTHPRCRLASPAASHRDAVARLRRATGATGKLVANAQHAALSIAEGSVWVTRDGGGKSDTLGEALGRGLLEE
jgi:hypothetical protein